MALITLHNIRMAFGGPLLLDDVSLQIDKGQRICILGRNGTGKSTLLKIIASEIQPDAGQIIASPGLRAAYLPQDVPDKLSGPLLEIVVAGAGVIGEKLAQWHRLVATHSGSDELHTVQQYLDENDGWRILTEAKRALSLVKLDGDLDFATLSGGLRRRALLARALVSGPDVLLLDEPTNHLDIQSIEMIESLILETRRTVMFVTHDRKFLRRLATRIVELDRGKLLDWSCDYETFLERKKAVLDAEEQEWNRFDKKLAQEEVWIRRGIKARRTRNEGRVRALLRMREERRKRRQRSGTVKMTISEAQRSGEQVLEAKNLSYGFGDIPIIRNLTITIERGDKIGILGPNGCGKTTLLKLLLGSLTPQLGTIDFGTKLQPIYFDQLRETLMPDKTVWENVAPHGADTVNCNGSTKHIIGYLQDFLFTPDRARSPVKQLSGGECNRLMLARMFTQPSNVLVLDEPTNDLDTETLELLEELLGEYNGTVLVVSHDREFLNNVVTSTLVFEGNAEVKEYVGGYDDWDRQKSELAPTKKKDTPEDISPRVSAPQTPNLSRRLGYKEKLLLESLPGKIETLEEEQNILHQQMASPEFFQKPGFISDAKKRLAIIETELAEAYLYWEELEKRR